MTQDLGNYERHKSAYRAGHVLPDRAPHIRFSINLMDYLKGPDRKGLLADLKGDIDRLERQARDLGSSTGPVAAEFELVGETLYITGAIVDVTRAMGGDPPPPEPPAKPPRVSPPTNPGQPTDDESTDKEPGKQPEMELGELGDPEPGRADPGQDESASVPKSTEDQKQYEDAAWRVREIALLREQKKIGDFETLIAEIDKGPRRDLVRAWLIEFDKGWKPIETYRGLLEWTDIKPISGYLPSRSSVVLDAQVYKIDPTTRTALLQIQSLHTKDHADVLAKFGTPRRPYLPVHVSTYELSDLLAFYRGTGLAVRVSATVQFSLVPTKKPHLVVTLSCPVETSRERIEAAVAKKLAMVLDRPRQLELFDSAPAM